MSGKREEKEEEKEKQEKGVGREGLGFFGCARAGARSLKPLKWTYSFW
jgi:hypothetical protein